jgi:glucokinase
VSSFIDVLAQIVAHVRADFPQNLVGIGVGIPGVYDYQQQVLVLAENLEWANLDLVRLIRERLPLDVYVVNRANAAALGEKWYGAGRGRNDLVFLHIGSGIKAGLIVNGELYSGSNGSAGEIGHMTIVADGPVCVCGKRGCLEALASSRAILERLTGLVRAGRAGTLAAWLGRPIETLTRADVLLAAHAGDPTVLEILQEAAAYIGIGIANLINVFNPECVILGGMVRQTPPMFLDTIKAYAARHAFQIPWQATEIVTAALGADAVAIGAAALLLADYLQPSKAVFSPTTFEPAYVSTGPGSG